MAQSLVVLERDPKVAQYLAWGLRPHFQTIHFVESRDELREKLSRDDPKALVLDIEFEQLADVKNLRRDFPKLPIVCTHRIPDEEMWTAALDAGASDVCPANDVENVLTSVLRSMALSQGAAA
jgi:DNA-binding response OmpR family regulator